MDSNGVVVTGGVLRKKLQSALRLAADNGAGADRAWRLAFARATRDMLQLPVDFVGLSSASLSVAELLDLPPDRSLILMLEGPQEGLGLLILSPELLAALIEVMTMGRCGTQAAVARKPTRTDAAMLSPLADLALANLEESLSDDADLVWTSGFRYASFIEEARSLALLLEDAQYRTVTARIAVAQGARAGDMVLALPADGRGPKPQSKPRKPSQAPSGAEFAQALAARVDMAACTLDAVLARVSMPLADILALQADHVLPLPDATLENLRFDGLDGRKVAEGKLGQHRGMRAVRLQGPSSLAPLSGLGPTAHSYVTGFGSASGLAADPAEPDGFPSAFDGFPATGTD